MVDGGESFAELEKITRISRSNRLPSTHSPFDIPWDGGRGGTGKSVHDFLKNKYKLFLDNRQMKKNYDDKT